jgi:hypothetical protein
MLMGMLKGFSGREAFLREDEGLYVIELSMSRSK